MRQHAKNATGRRAPRVLTALLASTALFVSTLTGQAQDSTWSATPGSQDYNTPWNWLNGVPTGTAFFGASSIIDPVVNSATTLDGWTLLSGALDYMITNHSVVNFNGDGISVLGRDLTIFNSGGSSEIHFNNASTAGRAAFLSNGVITFSDTSTAGTAIIFNDGSLIFSDNATAADARIDTANGATTAFNGNSSGGTARFTINAGGVLDVSNITGSSITAGSIEGAGSIQLGAKELVVGGNNRSTVFSGAIFDGGNVGALTKVGSGILTLTTTSGYTGDTTIDGGTLLVNGSIASSSTVFVNPGGTLGGTGIVPFTVLDNGATLAPGTPTSLGTLTINDRVMFCACSTFAVKVSSAGSDSVNVVAAGLGIGDTFLAGAVKVSLLNGSYRFNTPYTILTTAGGLNNTQFDSLVLPAGVTGALGYTTNDVMLTLDATLGQTPGLSGNQQSVGNAIDAGLRAGNPVGAFSGLFGGDINGKLGQLSGQPATGLAPAGMQMTGSFLNTMLHPTSGPTGGSLSGGAIGYAAEPRISSEAAAAYAAVTPKDRRASFAPVEPRWGVWGQFYGGHRTTDGDAASGAADTTARTYGIATGFDYRAAPDLVIGMALAGGSMNYGVANGLGGGKSDVFQLGVYGTKKFGAAYVSAALSYAWHDASTDRTVTVSGIDRLTADFSAHSFGGRLEGGYRYDAAMLGVTPYAAVQVQSFRTSAYSETAMLGSNAFALSYDARTVNATRTELGAWFDKTVAFERGSTVTWRGRVAWAHDFNNDQSVNAAFQTLPGASFTVDGAQPSANAALLSAGAELRLINNWSVAAKFDGEFASGARTYAGTGTLRYVW